MKRPPFLLALTGGIALLGALLLAPSSSGQAAAAEDGAVSQLMLDVVAQQTAISDNHAKIDEKLAGIAEDVRVARIFVGRGGGKSK